MLHVNEKYFTSHSYSAYEKTVFDKKIIWKVEHDVRQLKKTPQISYNPYGLKILLSFV